MNQQVKKFHRTFDSPSGAQKYMLQMLSEFPINRYDTRLGAVPQASSDGLVFQVTGTRRAQPWN